MTGLVKGSELMSYEFTGFLLRGECSVKQLSPLAVGGGKLKLQCNAGWSMNS